MKVKGPGPPPLRLKLPHVFDQPLHALDRHGVVGLGAHAADGAVAFELHYAARFRAFQELAVDARRVRSTRTRWTTAGTVFENPKARGYHQMVPSFRRFRLR